MLVYAVRVRICVHTANLIYPDWNHKTQGAWFQDFPRKPDSGGAGMCSTFEDEVLYQRPATWIDRK